MYVYLYLLLYLLLYLGQRRQTMVSLYCQTIFQTIVQLKPFVLLFGQLDKAGRVLFSFHRRQGFGVCPSWV